MLISKHRVNGIVSPVLSRHGGDAATENKTRRKESGAQDGGPEI
jgi:hypothetical protein